MKSLIYNSFDWEVPTMEKPSLAYISIPKAANTSLLNALFHALPEQLQQERLERVRESKPPVRYDSPPVVHFAKHLMFDRIQRKKNLQPGSLVFTCVRHPLSRFLSFYNDKIMIWDPFIEKKITKLGFQREMDVQDCVNTLVGLDYEVLDEHLLPCTMFAFYEGKNLCDITLKVEHLPVGWQYMQKLCGFTSELGQENRSDRRNPVRATLDSKYSSLVEEYYWEDMVLFGYASKPPAPTTVPKTTPSGAEQGGASL